MLHDKHMDRCHAKGLLCLNRRINDACFLTSTLPTGTLRSVSMQLISSIFPCYYFDLPQQMTNRFSSLQKYSQANAQSAAALIWHSFLAASSCVASHLPTGTKKGCHFTPLLSCLHCPVDFSQDIFYNFAVRCLDLKWTRRRVFVYSSTNC